MKMPMSPLLRGNDLSLVKIIPKKALASWSARCAGWVKSRTLFVTITRCSARATSKTRLSEADFRSGRSSVETFVAALTESLPDICRVHRIEEEPQVNILATTPSILTGVSGFVLAVYPIVSLALVVDAVGRTRLDLGRGSRR
jgi:hypothetical protein